MRKFHSIAALCGDGLRPELQALFDRLAIDPHSELFLRRDGMIQPGPDPVSESPDVIRITPKRVAYCPMSSSGQQLKSRFSSYLEGTKVRRVASSNGAVSSTKPRLKNDWRAKAAALEMRPGCCRRVQSTTI
jgi:hypothetical protein